jgi:hypothetical protein
VHIGEGRHFSVHEGRWWIDCDCWSLTRATQLRDVLGLLLVLVTKARPLQPTRPLPLQLTRCLHHATHFWHTQFSALLSVSGFFSSRRACPWITTRAAYASKASVI